MNREDVLAVINQVLRNNGSAPAADAPVPLREAGFRSLDFSEVALRIEDKLDCELNFEASSMRRIATISDVVDFFVGATAEHAG